jgi:hypothetical protein
VPRSMQLHKERIATSTPKCQAGVLVVRGHHQLVRVQPLAERANPSPDPRALASSSGTKNFLLPL